MRRLLLAGAVFAVFSGPIAMSAVAQSVGTTISGRCPVTETKFIVSDEPRLNSSDTFVNLPQSKVRFTREGDAPGCVIVRITGEVYIESIPTDGKAAQPQALLKPVTSLRVLLDGEEAIPMVIRMPNYNGNNTYARDLVFKNVAPGFHKVQVQWLNYNPDSLNVESLNRSLVVQY